MFKRFYVGKVKLNKKVDKNLDKILNKKFGEKVDKNLKRKFGEKVDKNLSKNKHLNVEVYKVRVLDKVRK